MVKFFIKHNSFAIIGMLLATIFIVIFAFSSYTSSLEERIAYLEEKTEYSLHEVLAEKIIKAEKDLILREAKYLFMEYAYMEGQIDAISGQVRVKKSHNDWLWVISPWEDGRNLMLASFQDYKDYVETRY